MAIDLDKNGYLRTRNGIVQGGIVVSLHITYYSTQTRKLTFERYNFPKNCLRNQDFFFNTQEEFRKSPQYVFRQMHYIRSTGFFGHFYGSLTEVGSFLGF